jgi:hypothetical protein
MQGDALTDEIRFPTAEEWERGWQEQCLQEEMKRRGLLTIAPPLTEAEAELNAAREAAAEEALPPPLVRPFCPVCGKVFVYKTDGMARMQRTRHLTFKHPEAVAAD